MIELGAVTIRLQRIEFKRSRHRELCLTESQAKTNGRLEIGFG